MSFLKDNEWEKMDWLNRAVEPFTFSLNTVIAKIPSESALDYYSIINRLNYAGEIRVDYVVKKLLDTMGCSKNDIQLIDCIGYNNLFMLRLEPDTVIDLDSKSIKGGVYLTKVVESLSDDTIRELLPQLVLNILRISINRSSAAYVNEVMDILDCKEARSSSSVRKKLTALNNHIYNIYRDNTWNIRNVDLAIKMLWWIRNYCERGDRCALANLSKLKCMIHNGHPIYSMEEIV